jgi:hypothetical protein
MNTNTADRAASAAGTFADLAMRAVVDLSFTHEELRAAKTAMGVDRFADLASASLRYHCKRVLVEEREQRQEELATPFGEIAAKVAMGDVVASVTRDVIAGRV